MSVNRVSYIANRDEPLETVFHHILTRGSDRLFAPRAWPEATTAIPGTPEKIAILRARLETGVKLHHPDDTALILGGDVDALRCAGVPIEIFPGNQRSPVGNCAPRAMAAPSMQQKTMLEQA